MQYRNLAGTQLNPSVLGFGCASVMGRVGAARSRAAIHAALDAGINYFDIARSYGFGQAEALLGGVLAGRRDKVYIASKFGIVPPARNSLRDFLKPVLRPLVKGLRRLAPAAHRGLQRQAGGMVSTGQFDLQTARQSLEESLRALQTDYLDVWHLHDCAAEIAQRDDLFEFLDRCVAEGKIRNYGVASSLEAASAVIAARAGVRIAQFASNIADDAVRRFDRGAQVAVVTHSPFGRGDITSNLASFLSKDVQATDQWSKRLGIDLRTPGGVSAFLLRYALAANGKGIVICGMYNPAHIRANAAMVDKVDDSGTVEAVADEMRVRNAFAAN